MLTFDASKRALLQRSPAVRLPWSLDEAQFTDACTRCGDCLRACPEAIVIKSRGGFPELNFDQGGCTLCGDCVAACKEPLFRAREQAPFAHNVHISNACFPHQGIECRSCGDACDVRAIKFQFGANRMATPQINAEDCTGCGMCLSVCPADAMSLQIHKETQTA